jgi:serine/threonine-protein kinase
MSNPQHSDAEAAACAARERIARVREQFQAAWERALQGRPQPQIDSYITRVSEPERATLRSELTQLEQGYRDRAASDSKGPPATGDSLRGVAVGAPQPPGVLTETLDFAPAPASEQAQTETPDFPTSRQVKRPGVAADESATATSCQPQVTPRDCNQTVESTPERGTDALATSLKCQDTNPASTQFSLDASVPERASSELPLVTGYLMLRVLGRGGMGVVYLAQQKGLGRLVALKMVLAGAHASSKRLARFEIEAQAVAHLQHPNIVQIYEIGSHEGLPYFSLEYLDGGNLADKIAGMPQPPREAAQTVEVLARAMAYAHQNGIIHRDLKPVNVLLTKDGQPKITDFGLAKRLEEKSSQTHSGDILGTPCYVAPEQASGNIKAMGPLVDVYALGAILYELLTGRPPFLGSTILETLEQVRSQEPVPPSHLQPRLPVDLETICLKCLEKDPPKRYASAEVLAEDLRRFLVGEPILARPVGSLERLWRWCKRNPRVASLSAAVLALLVLVTVGSVVAAIQINFQKQSAEEARDLADKSAEEAQRARQRADDNAQVAQEQANLAVKTFYQVVIELQNQLRDRPDMQKLRSKLLNDALVGLNEVAKSAENSNLLRRTLGGAYQRMGDVAQEMGQTAEAGRQYDRALSIFEQLAAQDPRDEVSKWNLAVMYEKEGTVNHRLHGDITKTRDWYRKATQLREALAARPRREPKLTQPLVDNALAGSYAGEANLALLMGDPFLARDYFQKALELRQKLADADSGNLQAKEALAVLYVTLGQVSFHLRDANGAQANYLRSLQLREALAQSDPGSVPFKQSLVDSHQKLGDMLLHLRGREALETVRQHYTISHTLQQKLYDKNPENTEMQQALASSYYRLGTVAIRQGNKVEADKQFRACLQLRETLARDDAKNLYKQVELLLAQARSGDHAQAAELAGRLRAEASKDAGILYYLGCGYALCAAAIDQGMRSGHPTPEQTSSRERYVKEALTTLGQAIAGGYHDLVALETDPDLESLQGTPGYQKLVQQVKQR